MNKNNNNMNNSSSTNKPADSKHVVINHYHYNGNTENNENRRNRRNNNNKGRWNNRGKKNKIPPINQSINQSIDQLINQTRPVHINQPKPVHINQQKPVHINQPKSVHDNTVTNENKPSHIIVRSTTDPTNMRIIPFSQDLNPYMLHSNILKSIIDREKGVKEKEEFLNERKNEDKIEEEFVELSNITNIDDLIKEGDKFDIEDKRRYPIDMLKLKNIIGPLKELQNVIGMESVKKNVFEQLLYILQDLHDTNMMHTVIEGPPGVGKTLLGKILGKIYYKLNFLKKSEKNKNDEEINDIANHLMAMLNPNSALMRNGVDKKDEKKDEKKKEDDFKFKVVRRSDLVGQYVGSTAIKTQKVIDEIEGGVLFIDEVYSLGSGGSNDKSDSFAKEAIDTLNQNLSENGDKFICIIAGYMNEIDRCFFAQNDGLRRRFPFKYSIEKYNSAELTKILEFKINEIKWSLDKNLVVGDIEKFIEKNKKSFENFGGDIETLLLNIKIKHSTRVFGKDPKIRKLITMEDIKNAYTEFLKIRKEKEIPQFVKDMYT